MTNDEERIPEERSAEERSGAERRAEERIAEERIAERLVQDLERVLGAGVAIDVVSSEPGGRAVVRATVLAEGMIETIEVEAASEREAYPELIRRAAQLRLTGAWPRMITLT